MADDFDFGATIRGMVPGQKVFGRYTLTRILGRGGMGLVWLARDGKLERDVALKFLPELVALDARAVDDLKRETKRALDLTHPHIVRIYDFVDDARSAAIAMEWVDGPTLSILALERADRVFAVAELEPWVKQLCEALTYAHEKALVVHRDLKPANLMIDRAGDLKVTDFGVSATLSDSTTRVSKAAGTSGTPLYMSPQQLMGEKPAVSDDIYALGATLYELLTGKAPFYSGGIEMQVMNKTPPSLASRRADLGVAGGGDISAAWEETIAACLAKEPGARPQRAGEVWERLNGGRSAKHGDGEAKAEGLNPAAWQQYAANSTEVAAKSLVKPSERSKISNPKSKIPAIAAAAAAIAVIAVAGWWFGVHTPETRGIEAERLVVQREILEREPVEEELSVNAQGGGGHSNKTSARDTTVAGLDENVTLVAAGIRDGQLHYAISAESRDLDPQVLVSFNDMKIILALFEGLTALDETTSQAIPAAAAHWDVSADQLTWTFHLHPGQHWSDGAPLAAPDFVFSIQRALSPALGAEYVHLLFPIVGAQEYNEGETEDFSTVGVRALDANTLQLRLQRPYPLLPAILAMPIAFPVPAHVLNHGGRRATDRTNPWTRPGRLVGNGPFLLSSRTFNNRVVCERNHNYRQPVAPGAIQSVVFHVIEDATAQEAAFRIGNVHLTSTVSLASLAAYREGQPELLRLDPFFETGFLRFNVTRPPLDDIRVRRALALCIDRERIAGQVLAGGHQPASRLTPPNTAGYTATATQPHDPSSARELLAAAGYPEGLGFPPLVLMSLSNEGHRHIMEELQRLWSRELGVTVKIVFKERRALWNDEDQLNYDISLGRWIGSYVDPGAFLDTFTAASSNNSTGWGDPAYDNLIAAAGIEPTEDRRHGLFQEAEAMLLAAAPIAPIYHGTRAYLIHPSLRGWHESMFGFNRFHNLRFDP